VPPKSPYTHDLHNNISKLPPGFAKLASSTELSVQHIDALHDFVDWANGNGKPTAQLVSALIGLPDFTQTARLLSQAMLAHVFFKIAEKDQIESSTSQLAQTVMQMTTARIICGQNINQCDSNFVTWACLVLQKTTEDTEPDTWRWANKKLCSMRIQDGILEKLGEMFLPLPDMQS
jgi:hypothetical protein